MMEKEQVLKFRQATNPKKNIQSEIKSVDLRLNANKDTVREASVFTQFTKELHKPLPPANKFLCLISLAGATYLLYRGAKYAQDYISNSSVDETAMGRDMGLMGILYLYEVFVAFLCKSTTLKGWKQLNFVRHHLMVIILHAFPTYLNPNISKHISMAIFCGFLLHLNEMTRTLATMGLQIGKSMQILIACYIAMVSSLATFAAAYQGVFLVLYTFKNWNKSGIVYVYFSMTTFLLGSYQACVVVPYYIKRLVKLSRSK